MADEIVFGREFLNPENGLCCAFGHHATADGKGSIALGAYAGASGEYALAVGTGAKACGKRAIAIGDGAIAEGDGVVVVPAEFSSETVESLQQLFAGVFLELLGCDRSRLSEIAGDRSQLFGTAEERGE